MVVATPARIGVVSDTHIIDPRHRVIPAAVFETFLADGGVACILHAGDIACREVLDELGAIAPVHAVYGNVDPPDLARTLQRRLVVPIGGVSVGLTHGHLGRGDTTPERARSNFTEAELGDGRPGEDGATGAAGAGVIRAVVFGHSHEPYNRAGRGILLFNPGSPIERRRQPRTSFGLLTVADGAVRGEILYL